MTCRRRQRPGFAEADRAEAGQRGGVVGLDRTIGGRSRAGLAAPPVHHAVALSIGWTGGFHFGAGFSKKLVPPEYFVGASESEVGQRYPSVCVEHRQVSFFRDGKADRRERKALESGGVRELSRTTIVSSVLSSPHHHHHPKFGQNRHKNVEVGTSPIPRWTHGGTKFWCRRCCVCPAATSCSSPSRGRRDACDGASMPPTLRCLVRKRRPPLRERSERSIFLRTSSKKRSIGCLQQPRRARVYRTTTPKPPLTADECTSWRPP